MLLTLDVLFRLKRFSISSVSYYRGSHFTNRNRSYLGQNTLFRISEGVLYRNLFLHSRTLRFSSLCLEKVCPQAAG